MTNASTCALLLISLLTVSALPASGKNLALGNRYTLLPEPNYRLCTDHGDATQLADGKLMDARKGSIWVDIICKVFTDCTVMSEFIISETSDGNNQSWYHWLW